MDSHSVTLDRRTPQRPRGERRVAELLSAAAAVIAEVGYDAATMTAIAERAGSSIGAVYQYFPNKDAIVRALRSQYGDALEERWAPLNLEAGTLTTEELVERIYAVLLDFIETHPAFVPLLNSPPNLRRDPAARNRVREQFAALFRERRPSLEPQEAFRIANVTMQIIRAMNPLFSEAEPTERAEIVREFKLVLTAYLTARLDEV